MQLLGVLSLRETPREECSQRKPQENVSASFMGNKDMVALSARLGSPHAQRGFQPLGPNPPPWSLISPRELVLCLLVNRPPFPFLGKLRAFPRNRAGVVVRRGKGKNVYLLSKFSIYKWQKALCLVKQLHKFIQRVHQLSQHYERYLSAQCSKASLVTPTIFLGY